MNPKKHLPLLASVLSVVALCAVPSAASADLIRIQSTTDTKDAGLVTGLLEAAYTAAPPGDSIDYVGVGTGQALDNARAGLADVVITHAPSLEQEFVDDGYSLEPFGHAIFFSDYVILGPKDDPAGVFTGAPNDAVTAYETIAAAGDAGKAYFLSRANNSGTNVQEQVIWGLTNVPKAAASNGGGDPTRFVPVTADGDPDGGGEMPGWYKETNLGQAKNVQETDVCPPDKYPGGGCYTMVDRGTFNNLVNSSTVTKLKIVTEKNVKAARGGEDLLVNPFSAYIVNPAKVTSPAVNVAAAQRFVDFLVSPEFQSALESFPTAADPAFRPDAFPTLAAIPALPTVATAGSPVPFTVTASNKLPGGGTIAGIPVQLQSSTDGGRAWANVGTPVNTDAAGKAAFSPTIGAAATTYRVSVPRYRQFTATASTLGVVGSTPAATTTPITTPAKDTTKPTVSKPKLTSKRITLTLSEAGTVKVTIKRAVTRTTTRNGKRRTTTTYKTVKRLTLKATKAGTVSRAIKSGLKAGRYKLTFAATDAAGNTKSRAVSFTVQSAAKTKAG